MSRLFYNHRGRNCDILHSTYFNSLTFQQRQKLAFNKKELAKFNKESSISSMAGNFQRDSLNIAKYRLMEAFSDLINKK